MNSLVWLHGKPEVSGILKQSPADFVVKEDLGFEPDGEGEHVLVYLRKTGCNTQFVADALARFARIPARSVSYAGLKDRQAVTEQWFCLHIPGKETPDFRLFTLEGCEVLVIQRHRRKLRIGYLKGNAFELVLREVSQQSALEQRLALIVAQGVPNYFGEQRFGRGGNNLQQAERWAKNEIQVKERSKRSFYLSAARSALFNTVVSARIQSGQATKVLSGDAMQLAGRGSWFVAQADELESVQLRLDRQELFITAPLPGDGDLGSQGDALAFESQLLATQPLLSGLLKRERLECARRAALVIPQSVNWQWLDEKTLSLHFYLPAGSYATSLVRELMLITDDRHFDITE